MKQKLTEHKRKIVEQQLETSIPHSQQWIEQPDRR